MSRFSTILDVEVLPADEVARLGSDRQLYRLTRSLVYISDLVGTIACPTGMVTNFASIPRPVWNIIDPEDPCILFGSVVHDYCYGLAGKLPDRARLSREQADQMLREAMGVCGASAWQKFAVYNALRLFGASAWKISP